MQKRSFKIENKIYLVKALKKAVIDFKGVSKILIDSGWITIYSDSEESIEEIFNEFMNYTLWIQLNY